MREGDPARPQTVEAGVVRVAYDAISCAGNSLGVADRLLARLRGHPPET